MTQSRRRDVVQTNSTDEEQIHGDGASVVVLGPALFAFLLRQCDGDSKSRKNQAHAGNDVDGAESSGFKRNGRPTQA